MGAAAGAYDGGSFENPWEALRRLREQAGAARMGGHPRGRQRNRPPWGPWAGGPWTPPWAGGWPGERFGGGGDGPRPRAPKGNVRIAILALLWEGPRHGYQLMQDIAERSHGQWRPSPGSVYPVLSALQDEGLVDDEKLDGRRVFSLTAAGQEHVQERADELAAAFDGFTTEEEHPELVDMRQLLMSVGTAAIQVLATGSPAQVDAAQTILAQTRRDLYGVLAADAGAEDES